MRNRISILAFMCPVVLAACDGLGFGADDPSDDDPGYPPGSSYPAPSDPPGYLSIPPAPDASPSAPPNDAGPPPDGTDAGTSAAGDSGDAGARAGWPSIDATVGAPDHVGCPDGAPRVGYLMSQTGVLSRFDPDTLAVTRLGLASCPTVVGGAYSPTAMAASRSGMLYVLYTSWNHYSGTGSVFAVDPVSLVCTLTPWTPLDLDFDGDVGIAVQRTSGDEGLLVLGTVYEPTIPDEVTTLARADLATNPATMLLSVIAKTPDMNYAPGDIQADGYNRLFRVDRAGSVARLDPASGAVLGVDAIPGYVASPYVATSMVVNQDVYAFATRDTNATVYRYNLLSKTTTATATLSGNVTAATASPCSP